MLTTRQIITISYLLRIQLKRLKSRQLLVQLLPSSVCLSPCGCVLILGNIRSLRSPAQAHPNLPRSAATAVGTAAMDPQEARPDPQRSAASAVGTAATSVRGRRWPCPRPRSPNAIVSAPRPRALQRRCNHHHEHHRGPPPPPRSRAPSGPPPPPWCRAPSRPPP